VGEDYTEWGFWKRLFSPGRFERSRGGCIDRLTDAQLAQLDALVGLGPTFG
jgi:hypothetical protein